MSMLTLENLEKMSASSHTINICSHHYQSSSFIGGFDVNPTLIVTLNSALLSSTQQQFLNILLLSEGHVIHFYCLLELGNEIGWCMT
jgi:hypothetical protein